MAFRIDRGTLRKPARLADGRLRVDGYLTRPGVFDYRNPDGSIRREYRPAAEVFRADALATFELAIVTDDHPPEMITARNARQYGVGQLAAMPREDDGHVAITMTVNDADVIAKMEAGKVELSAGYEVDLIERAGVTPEGLKYDAIQTNIRGNHVAIVAAGRAGPTSRVRMDASELIGPSAQMENTVDETELKAALEAEKTRADAEKARADALQAKVDAAADEDDDEDEESGKKVPAFLKKKIAKKDARIAELESQLVAARNDAADAKLAASKAEAARNDAAATSMATARARIALEAKAAAVLGTEFKADASDRDLMVAVVKRVDGEDVPADASMDFVRGIYAGASKRHDAGADALAGLRLVIAPPTRADASVPDEEAAARKMREDSANAWKTKENK